MILAIIQARMGSSRLPGKILMDLYGKPSLYRIFERLSSCKKINKIIVATSEEKANDSVRDFCRENDILCFSGSEDDVLKRFFEAAVWAGAGEQDVLVRITGDCPLIDPQIVDETIEYYIESKMDYVSNSNPPSFPDGLDCEVFGFKPLELAYHNAALLSEREHVTLFIRNHPEIFTIGNVGSGEDHSMLRWTLDEYEDYLVIRAIYEELYHRIPRFGMEDILALYKEKPELAEINAKFTRNEGLRKSLEKESGGAENETN
jgi:spore coat polysaccharide biosynthesis protein SpsF